MDCPECERELRPGAQKCSCGWTAQSIEKVQKVADDTWTWQLRPTDTAKPITMTVKCGLCRLPMYRKYNGYCANCQRWPINVTPIRACQYGHAVQVDGWCSTCEAFMLSAFEAQPGEWIDTGIIGKRLTKAQMHDRIADILKTLSGPGWPERELPLRRDMIPRRWKNAPLRVTGQTPLGHDIVLPEHTTAGSPSEPPADVPF